MSLGRGAAPAPTAIVTPAFLALATATLAFFVAGGALLPVAPRFAAGPLAADPTGVGISIGVFSLAALAMRPVVGWASDRFGRRPLLVGGSLITIAALGLHLVAVTLPVFVAARALLGVGEAFFFVATLSAGADLAPPARRGEALSFLSLSLYLGVAIGPFLGETMLGLGGFSAVWLAAGGIAAAAALLSWLTPETAPPAAPGEARPRGRLFHPAGLFPGFLALCGTWGMGGYFAFLPLRALELGMTGSGVPLAAFGIVVVVLRLFFAKLPDQVGAVRLSGAAFVLAAAGLALLGAVASPLGLVVGTVVFAAGVAFIFPALMSMAVGRVPPEERGSVVGTTSLFLDLSFGLAPAALGAVVRLAGYSGAFLVAAGVALVGALLLFARRDAVAAPRVG
ncbi:MAG TPA: MFS transporter [Candidatus Limnocylindrales bacterium]|nr:MFS transporter [Candidatus Limnocylindrales bacterium]